MGSLRSLVWFRGKDLRVHDHAALHLAAQDSRELIPVFVLSPEYFGPGGTERAPNRLRFVIESLRELAQNLADRGSRLLIVHGPAGRVIPHLASALRVDRVLAIRSGEPASRSRDERIRARLSVPFVTCLQETLLDPEGVRTGAGGVFRVYSPFARACNIQLEAQTPLAAPRRLPPLPAEAQLTAAKEVELPELASVGLAESADVLRGGERAARQRLKHFLAGPIAHYAHDRDRMDLPGTSRLSADLRFGTLSVRAVWAALAAQPDLPEADRSRFFAELLWREFAHYTLWHDPRVLSAPFRPEFRAFPWRAANADFEAWWQGTTGYPVADASARQLLSQGAVDNRARMISASFLTKHLLVHYQHGEAHYLRYLTDGDPAQNNMGWQWSAGCGCDAQPYFRVFNPVTQGERFDPEGAYVRRHVPELARLPARYIHAPWTAPATVLRQAGVRLGDNYPEPIVDHAAARKRFLLVAADHLKRGTGHAHT